jgi:hypothetical protein
MQRSRKIFVSSGFQWARSLDVCPRSLDICTQV